MKRILDWFGLWKCAECGRIRRRDKFLFADWCLDCYHAYADCCHRHGIAWVWPLARESCAPAPPPVLRRVNGGLIAAEEKFFDE